MKKKIEPPTATVRLTLCELDALGPIVGLVAWEARDRFLLLDRIHNKLLPEKRRLMKLVNK